MNLRLVALAYATLPFLLASSMALSSASASAQFPRTVGDAMRLYEGEVELEKWADGPAQLIMLQDEKEVWEDLENDEQRRSFVDWFWARRDNDLRDPVNPVMMAFYTRIGEANGRFTGIPRGWKTDRGRVWSVLGGPDRVRTGMEDEDETWNYWAPGLEPVLGHSAQAGELNIYFARRDQRTYRIAGGVGPGVWPPYVLRVLEFVNQAMIANPDLEFLPGSG